MHAADIEAVTVDGWRGPVLTTNALAVLADAPTSVQASRDPRTVFAIAQPGSDLIAQQWKFSQRQSASPELFGSPRP